MEYERFFAEVSARLDAARSLERELDRELVPRFNFFDYLRDDELGLSRVIADLLDPQASHGQATLFLRTLLGLEGLKNARHWPDLDGHGVRVVVQREREISHRRRIDILVEIAVANRQRYCLAIENKPYAADQENQVQDYLEWLQKEYPKRFFLIYMPPTGERPSETSIRRTELDKWTTGFAIMPYCAGSEERTDEDGLRMPHSFVDWVQECRRKCEADRLRLFLRELEIYCNRTFGDQTMTTDRERKAAHDFILSRPEHLTTGLAVAESWPDVRDDVCEKFLKRLCSQIEREIKEKLKEFAVDIRVLPRYARKGQSVRSRIWLFRDSWSPYEVEQQETEQHDSNCRTCIDLTSGRGGPDGWYIAVSSPLEAEKMTNGDKKRRQRLDLELRNEFGRGNSENWSPWWESVDKHKRNWTALVPVLHKENENGGGEVTDYFVEKFVEIAEKAIPVINDIKG